MPKLTLNSRRAAWPPLDPLSVRTAVGLLNNHTDGDVNVSDRLRAYLKCPSPYNWERLFYWVLPGGRTAWQLWTARDSGAPRHCGTGKPWPCVPDPELLFRALVEEYMCPGGKS